MSNHITAEIVFYYKGEKITAVCELDLEQYMLTLNKIPNLYPILAKACGLNHYSYEYEMLQAETIRYTKAVGMVEKFVTKQNLDIAAFELAWKENKVTQQLQQIAQQYLSISDLEQQDDIKKALLQAYYLGTQHLRQ